MTPGGVLYITLVIFEWVGRVILSITYVLCNKGGPIVMNLYKTRLLGTHDYTSSYA